MWHERLPDCDRSEKDEDEDELGKEYMRWPLCCSSETSVLRFSIMEHRLAMAMADEASA